MSQQKSSDEDAGAQRKKRPRKPASRKSTSRKPASGKSTSDKSASGKAASGKPASGKAASKKRTARKSAGGKRAAGKSAPRKRAAEKSTPPPAPTLPPPPTPTSSPPQAPTLPFPPPPTLLPPPEKTETHSEPPTIPEPVPAPPVSKEQQESLDEHTIPSVGTMIERPRGLRRPADSILPVALWRRAIRRGFSRVRCWVRPSAGTELTAAIPHTGEKTWLLHPAAVLLGLAAGWQWSGMRMILGATLDPSPATVTMLGAIALLMAAVGPRIPGRIVLGFVRLFGRRWRTRGTGVPDGSNTFWMLQAVRNRDESLLWLSLAVLCSAAGAVTLLTVLLRTPATQLYHYLLDRFFWTSLTLAGLEWAGVTILTGGAWLMNGLAIAALASAAAARSESRRSPPGIAAGLLLGLGIAWLLHDRWADRGMSGTQILMLGVLPMFALSTIAARLSQRAELRQPTQAAPEADAPELSGRAEGWIWLSLVVWGIGSVLAGSGWLTSRWVLDPRSPGTWGGPGGYLLVLATGVALASFHARRRKQSASGCGMALWAAGVGAGTAATLAAYWPTGAVAGLLQVMVLALPVGYALHYAERAWLARAGSETLGFAQMTTALLGGCAISLIAAHWWVQPALGPIGMMAAGALVMLAYGGLVQIYEENSPVHLKRLRLGLVFASLAAAIVLFPAGAKHWGSSVRAAARTDPLYVVPFESADLVRTRRICLIGLSPQTTIPALEGYTGEVDLLPLTRHDRTAATPVLSSAHTHTLATDGFRTLRLEHRVYDLIYQRTPRICPLARFAPYSVEWLTSLAQRTATGGKVILDIPLADMTTEAITVIAATFEQAMDCNSSWNLLDTFNHPTLRLKGTPDVASPRHGGLADGWSPVASLMNAEGNLPDPHSIRRDRITRTLKPKTREDPLFLVEWLKSRRLAEPPSQHRQEP